MDPATAPIANENWTFRQEAARPVCKRCAGLIFFAGFDSCDPGKNNLQPVFKPPSFRAPHGKFPQPIPACPQGTGNIRSFRESNCPASAEHNEKFS
jgi:hypothetical protein